MKPRRSSLVVRTTMEESSLPGNRVYDSVPLPLGETMCIRVIKIRPSTTQDDSDRIVCDFRILNIRTGQLLASVAISNSYDDITHANDPGAKSGSGKHDRTQYRALSYTWGNSPANETIELDGTPFMVRKNLWDFLSLARSRGFDTYLWIDAICIDQETVGERNHQVGMMGDVYSSAEGVIVWLGSCDEGTSRTLNLIFEELEQYNAGILRRLRREWRYHQRVALKSLCNRPYWGRAWVVQEYLLAKTIDIWYGSLRGSSRLVRQAISRMNTFRNAWLVRNHYELANAPISRILRYRHGSDYTRGVRTGAHENLRRLGFQPDDNEILLGTHKLRRFLGLLSTFNDLHCADRKDRIYALLPLLSSSERRDVNVLPDYDSTTTELFFQIAFRITHHCHRLNWPLRAIDQLCIMLQPDFNDRDAQRAVLRLRKLLGPRRYGTFASAHHHRCEGWKGPLLDFRPHGCARCGKAPFMTLSTICTTEFSQKDWQSWAWALLGSLDPDDRQFGSEILNDDYFGDTSNLFKNDHSKHFGDDILKHFGHYERTAFDNDRFRLIAGATKDSNMQHRRRFAGDREKKRMNGQMTRPMRPASARHYTRLRKLRILQPFLETNLNV